MEHTHRPLTHAEHQLWCDWDMRHCPACRLEAAKASTFFALVLALLMLAMAY